MPSQYAIAANPHRDSALPIAYTALKLGGGGGGADPLGSVAGRTDRRPVPVFRCAAAGGGARPLAGFAGANRRCRH